MSTYYYYANPEIYILPRGKKYLFEEEKQTVDGQEETIKKCEINKILNTYKDNESYDFHLSDKRFKAIESRIYLDLWKDYSNNKFTVSKKCCIGFFKYKDSKNDFMDKEAKFNCVELLCENSNNQLQVYLSNGKDKNKDDTSKSIILNLNYEENCVKEFTIWVEYKDNAILPVESELKLKAKFYGQKEWKKEVTFTLYRNTESSLNEFQKNSNNMDTDFFILPRYSPSQNQKKCIKELQIINNQVFARNANLANYHFVEESGEITKTENNTTTNIYEYMVENARKSLDAFFYNKQTKEGCKSGNKIGDLEIYYSYNFSNYGQQKKILDYLQYEYSIQLNTLEGIIYDRNFLFGNYKSGDSDAKIEGIVNLYMQVVVDFVDNLTEQINLYQNFNHEWLSCPYENNNYKRGPLTIQDGMNKNLYIGETNVIKSLSDLGYEGVTENNILPTGSVIYFKEGKDKMAFEKEGENYYEVESFMINNNKYSTGDNICIKLSLSDKMLCGDDEIENNFGNYNKSNFDYGNYGIPYFVNSGEMKKWDNSINTKLTKNELLNWNESKHNWYSYDKKPNTESFGIDCSGFVVNAVTGCDSSTNHYFRTSTLNISAEKFGNSYCRTLPITNNYDSNSYLTKNDIVFSSNHIAFCVDGVIGDDFNIIYVPRNDLETSSREFNICHNYGMDYIWTSSGQKYNLFSEKTIQGFFRHWGINISNGTISKTIAHIGRIYLWK